MDTIEQQPIAWNEAIEAAAKVCEGRIGGAVQSNEWWSGFKSAMKQCAEAIRALRQQAPQEPASCGGCNGSGWMVRDPDIGTDQECFACNGTGKAEQEQQAPAQTGEKSRSV